MRRRREEVLHAIASLCTGARDTESSWSKALSQDHGQEDLRRLLFEASKKLVCEVVPSTFWKDVGIQTPAPLDGLCPPVAEPSTLVLLLVLWSWCSPECGQQISSCLSTGAEQWCGSGDAFEWIRPYVSCAQLHMRVARSALMRAKSDVKTDASRLAAGVRQSSSLFGLITTQSPSEVFFGYAKYHRTRQQRPGLTGECVPALSWFKTVRVFSPLEKVAKLPRLKGFVTMLKAHSMSNHDCIDEVQKSAQRVAVHLNINPDDNVQLVVTAMLVDQVTKSKKHDNSFREALFMKLVSPVLESHSGSPEDLLKTLVEKKPPLLCLEAMRDYIQDIRVNRCITDEVLKRHYGQTEPSGTCKREGAREVDRGIAEASRAQEKEKKTRKHRASGVKRKAKAKESASHKQSGASARETGRDIAMVSGARGNEGKVKRKSKAEARATHKRTAVPSASEPEQHLPPRRPRGKQKAAHLTSELV